MKRNRNRRVNFIFNERKNSRMFLLCNFNFILIFQYIVLLLISQKQLIRKRKKKETNF